MTIGVLAWPWVWVWVTAGTTTGATAGAAVVVGLHAAHLSGLLVHPTDVELLVAQKVGVFAVLFIVAQKAIGCGEALEILAVISALYKIDQTLNIFHFTLSESCSVLQLDNLNETLYIVKGT
jgi:hypothetical protein